MRLDQFAGMALAGLVFAPPAVADRAATLTGNTLILTDAAGRATAYQLAEDGDMSFSAIDGRAGAGSWTVQGEKVCVTPGSAQMCLSVPADVAVGHGWEVKGPTGLLTFSARLAEGMVKP